MKTGKTFLANYNCKEKKKKLIADTTISLQPILFYYNMLQQYKGLTKYLSSHN